MPLHSDPFEAFAARLGLRVTTEELVAAPRDVLAPPAESERYVLATLSGPHADRESLRMLFVTEPADVDSPTLRDVLWWLSADSWAVEHAGRNYADWACMYRYADDDAAAMRRFKAHVRQATGLADLLGRGDYESLLGLYREQVVSAG